MGRISVVEASSGSPASNTIRVGASASSVSDDPYERAQIQRGVILLLGGELLVDEAFGGELLDDGRGLDRFLLDRLDVHRHARIRQAVAQRHHAFCQPGKTTERAAARIAAR
jgi:hypothetical protein